MVSCFGVMFARSHEASHQKGDALATRGVGLFDGKFTASEVHRLLHDIEVFAVYDPTGKRHLGPRHRPTLRQDAEDR